MVNFNFNLLDIALEVNTLGTIIRKKDSVLFNLSLICALLPKKKIKAKVKQ